MDTKKIMSQSHHAVQLWLSDVIPAPILPFSYICSQITMVRAQYFDKS